MAEMIPEGTYTAVAVPHRLDDRAVWAQFGVSKNGTKQVLIYFEILEGAHAGQRLPWFGYFTTDTWKRTLEALRFVGFRGEDLFKLPDQELDQEVQVVVEHHEYDGKHYARIAWVNRPGGATIKLANPLQGGELRQFAAYMQKKAGEVPEFAGKRVDRSAAAATNGARTPAPEPTPPPPTRSPGVDDDIPF